MSDNIILMGLLACVGVLLVTGIVLYLTNPSFVQDTEDATKVDYGKLILWSLAIGGAIGLLVMSILFVGMSSSTQAVEFMAE